MERKKAKRFLDVARQDYDHAIFWYVAMIESKADGPESIERARRSVLEAHKALDLAQQEFDEVQRHEKMGKDYTGVCEECRRTAPRWIVGERPNLRALCAECLEVDQ